MGNIEAKYKLFPSKLKEQVDERVPLLKTLAQHTRNFCLEITDSKLKLKKKHSYYIQVQGGMAITRQSWCDFVVYTTFMNHEDIHIERIYFDPTFWEGLKKKLLDFYLYAMVPELLTGRVKRGIPIGNCRNVRGLGKSMVVFRLFEKLRYSNERSSKFENIYQE